MNRPRRFCLGLALVVLTGASRLAAQTTWSGANSTDWSDPLNWNSGVPDGSTNAFIIGTNPAIISADASVGTLRVGDPDTASLTVSGGTFSSGLVLLGNDQSNYSADVAVTGDGTVWNTNGSPFFAGDYGTVTLNVSNAATVNVGDLDVAWNGSSHSTTVIDNATVHASGFADIANLGTARVTVQSGGQLTAASGIRVSYYGQGAGTLVAANNFSNSSGTFGSSTVSVGSHGTLAGNDFITGAVTINNGGHLAPGDSVAHTTGVLEFNGGLTLNSGAVLDYALSSTENTFLTLGTGAVLTGPGGGTVTVNVTDFGDFTAGTYTLLDWSAGSATGLNLGVNNFVLGSTISGYSFGLAINGSELDLSATAIPEPATCAALAGLGALGLVCLARRRGDKYRTAICRIFTQ